MFLKCHKNTKRKNFSVTSNCYCVKITEGMKLTFKKMVALVELCSRLMMYFPVIPKYSKSIYAHRPMCKLSLNILLGLSLSLGQVGREHMSLTGTATGLAGGLTLVLLLIGKMLLWYISSKLNFCQR